MPTPDATASGASREPCDLPTPESTKSFWHSEPSPLLIAHRTTRELPSTADVVIIGSGITGTSVAYHLLSEGTSNASVQGSESAGPSVVMLEAREACWGATGRNGGHCQPLLFEHPHDPSIPRFELANFHALQKLINSKLIQCEFVSQSAVRAIYSKQHLTETELSLLTLKETAPDIASRLRLITEQAELDELRIPGAKGAVITNIAARMWPYKFVSHILTELLTSNDLNGEFNLQTLTPATSLRAPDSNSKTWTVSTPRGSISAKKVVLATNAYTSHLLPAFSDLIVPCRGQMSALKPPPSLQDGKRLKGSYGFLGEGLDDYLIQRPGRQDCKERDNLQEATKNMPKTLLPPAVTGNDHERCQTCRHRKKKCDGRKPTCVNCERGHFNCRGYGPIPLSTGLTSGNSEALAGLAKRKQELLDLFDPPRLPFEYTERRSGLDRFHGKVEASSSAAPNVSGEHLMFGGGRQAGAPTVGVTDDSVIDEKTALYLRSKLIEALDLPEKKTGELTATHEWTGIMGFSRDDLPWVGPVYSTSEATSPAQPMDPLLARTRAETTAMSAAIASAVPAALSAASPTTQSTAMMSPAWQLLPCTVCHERKVECDLTFPCTTCCERGEPRRCRFIENEGDNFAPTTQSTSARELLSCTTCRERRVKCDRTVPCAACCILGKPEKCKYLPIGDNEYRRLVTQLTKEDQRSPEDIDHGDTGRLMPGLFLSAGYTGHGMPNAWLCGKAVSTMVRNTLSLPNDDQDVIWKTQIATLQAQNQTLVPSAYFVSEERIKKARALEEVGRRDWAEMERARARSRRAERPASGYA